jgi:hypothetical protein
MAALTAGRNTPEAIGETQEFPVLAATTLYAGGLAVLDSAGWCRPAYVATGLTCVGRIEKNVDNATGANGDLNVPVKAGTFRLANSAAGDLIAQADVGADCYLVDDATVAKTNGSSTRSVAGKIMQVDAQGVWVKI